MPKKEYGWEDGSVPEIAPHSLAKHRILREYVQRYLHVLTSVAPGMDVFRLTLVDGFAGGGEYVDARTKIVQPGSPLILLDAVRAAEAMINAARSKSLRIDANYVFIEKKRGVAAYLREVLKKRGDAPSSDGPISLLEGEFEVHLEEVITRVKSRGRAHRAIFLLDQYGYTGVPVGTLKRIFTELPNAEVFLTLAVGWITAYLPNASIAAAKLGIPGDLLRHLEDADEGALDLTDPNRRPDLLAIQQLLHHAFTTEAGSRFYTPFFIVSRESNRPYWFLHMANSPRANDVVKNLHWEIENHFAHFGRPGLSMLGYDADKDPNVTRQTTFDFSDAARIRTRIALTEEIPRRLSVSHADGVTFSDLFQSTCNETPATQELIAEVVRDLCVAGELEKRGGEGERRAPTTLPHGEDIIRLARQVLLSLHPGRSQDGEKR